MKRILFAFFIGMSVLPRDVWAQASCTQVLRTAQDTYNSGRLHELPTILKNCLETGGFSSQEKVTAYKLLTQAYIYLEEPELADESMLNLLKTDAFFEINEAVDPAEFIALYKKFRTKPVIGFVVKVGFNETFVAPTKIFSVGNGSDGSGKFSPSLGIYFGAGIEKQILSKKTNKLTFAPEFFVMSKAYKYSDPSILIYATGDPDATNIINFSQSRLDFYPMVQLRVLDGRNPTDPTNRKKRKPNLFNTYIAIGPGFSYLTKAQYANPIFNKLLPTGGSENGNAGATIDATESFSKVSYSVLAMAGIKFRIATIYITGDIRFQYGLSNAINPAKRSNQEAIFDYAFQAPDQKLHNVMISIGAIYPFFIPKKLIK